MGSVNPVDYITISSYVRYMWIVCFFVTLPCLIIHIKIIFSAIFSSTSNRARDLMEANLAFGAMIHMSAIAPLVLTKEFNLFGNSDFTCALRAMHFRAGMVIVTFTLTKIVHEARNSLTRNPLYQNIGPNRPVLTIIAINLASILVVSPMAFIRSFDPEQKMCVRELFLETEWVDWTIRSIAFFVVEIIPVYIILKEFKAIVKLTRDEEGIQNTEIGAFIQRKRVHLLQTSFAFISVFMLAGFPSNTADIFDSPAIRMPHKFKMVQDIILRIFNAVSYLMINAFPAYMFFAYRTTSNYL